MPRLPTRRRCVTTRHGPARLPIAPLLALAASRSELARRCGRARRTVQRWTATGLTLERAEDVASRLNRHPAEIWVEYEDAVAIDSAWRESRVDERNAARRRRRAMGSEQSVGRGSPVDCPGKADENVEVVG